MSDRVSTSHAHKLSIKTDAPYAFVWDMMKAYEKENPTKKKNWSDINKPIYEYEGAFSDKKVDFTHHPDSEPISRSSQLLRFQPNPTPNWGPKQKAKVITNKIGIEEIIDKRRKNQGKYTINKKRQHSEQDETSQFTKKEKAEVVDNNDMLDSKENF